VCGLRTGRLADRDPQIFRIIHVPDMVIPHTTALLSDWMKQVSDSDVVYSLLFRYRHVSYVGIR